MLVVLHNIMKVVMVGMMVMSAVRIRLDMVRDDGDVSGGAGDATNNSK